MRTSHNLRPSATHRPCIIHGSKLSAVVVGAALMLCLFGLPLPAAAHEVIVIKDTDIKPYRDAIQGFKTACGCTMKELGLSDNDVLAIVEAERPSAIFAVGTKAFKKARTIQDVPIIYTMVIPSETAVLSADNVSGVSMDIAPATYFAAMAPLFPSAKRIGVLFDPEHTGPFVEEASAVARNRGMTLIIKPVGNPQQVPAALNELRDKVDILWMLPDSTLVNSETIEYLMLFSFQNKLPVFSFAKKYVERGAVAALTIDPYDMGVQAGEQVRHLTGGERAPSRAYARTPHLIVNTKVAAKIGLRLDEEAIRNAEKVE